MTELPLFTTENGKAGEPVHLARRRSAKANDDIAWFGRMVRQAALAGVQTEVHRLTPDMARWLVGDDINPANRNVSVSKVSQYASDIREGRWDFNGEPIIISRDGHLNDGQHRAHAVIEAGQSVEVLWVFGVSRESRLTLDQGRTRTAGAYLQMDGFSYATSAARVASLVMQIKRDGAAHDSGPSRPTKTAVTDWVHSHPDIIDSCAAIPANSKSYGGHAAIATAHYLISEVAESEDVAEFFARLVKGDNLTSRHPILVCRNRLTLMVMNREKVNARIECIIRSWNNWRSQRNIRSITIHGGRLPQIAA